MRKVIERFIFITACCSLLGMLPLQPAQADDTGVDVAIASHFTPEVAAPPATIGLAPIDPRRPLFGICAGPGGNCTQGSTGAIIVEQPPGPICGFNCQVN